MAACSDIIIWLFLALLSSGTCENKTCNVRMDKKIFTSLWAKPSSYLIDGLDSWRWTFSLYFEPECFSEIIVSAIHPTEENQMISRINITECRKGNAIPDCFHLNDTFSEWEINITRTAYTTFSRHTLQVSVLPANDSSESKIWTKNLGTLPLINPATQHDSTSVIPSEPVTDEHRLGSTAEIIRLVLLVLFGIVGLSAFCTGIVYFTKKWKRQSQTKEEPEVSVTELTDSNTFSIESASEVGNPDISKFSMARDSVRVGRESEPRQKSNSVSAFSNLMSLFGLGSKASSEKDAASTEVDNRSNLTSN